MLFRLNFAKVLNNKYLVFMDQVLLSAINFGSILVLSKIASIAVFGSFVVIYSYGLFIFTFSSLLISGPILVFLAKKWEKKAGEYLTSSLFINLFINFLLSGICFFFLKNQIENLPYYLFFILPFGMTFFDIVKKFTFSTRNVPVKYALISTLIVTLLFFGQLFFYMDSLRLENILIIYWVSFFTGSVFLLTMIFSEKTIRESISFSLARIFDFGKEVWRTHFHYAKWIVLGGIAFWGYSQGIYILAEFYGVDDFTIGKVRTVQNLLGVFSILLIAMENQFTPILARNIGEKGILGLRALMGRAFKENYWKIGGLFLLAIPIGLFFYESLYGEKYGVGFVMFLIFWLVQLVLVIVKPLSIFLKSVESTKPFFISHALAAISILVFFPLMGGENPYSLPIAMMVANFLYVGYIVGCYFYLVGKTKKE